MYGGADRKIDTLVRGRASIAAGMEQLISLCERAIPHKVWNGFRKLDFDSDYDRLTLWLLDLLRSEPPDDNITGLWFGLHNPCLLDGRPSCRLYVCGSKRFKGDLDVPDWHCKPEYWPEGRYASSEVLPLIYGRTNRLGGELNAQAEISLCQGFMCLVISRWCRGPIRGRLLGKSKLRAIAAGHDSGDIHLIDVLRQS